MQIKEAVFHYDPTAKIKGRTYWTLGISTPEQRHLAWTYGHEKLILVDGTFGICDKYGIRRASLVFSSAACSCQASLYPVMALPSIVPICVHVVTAPVHILYWFYIGRGPFLCTGYPIFLFSLDCCTVP